MSSRHTPPGLLEQLPHIRASHHALELLGAYYCSHASELGQSSSHEAMLHMLLVGGPSGDGAKLLALHPDALMSDRVLNAAGRNRAVREMLRECHHGARTTLESIFAPKRFDTVGTIERTTEMGRPTGDAEWVRGPIDSTFGRFAVVALHTPSAGAWLAAERAAQWRTTDSALPWLRDLCKRADRRAIARVWHEIELIVQAAFDQFEVAHQAYAARKVRAARERVRVRKQRELRKVGE